MGLFLENKIISQIDRAMDKVDGTSSSLSTRARQEPTYIYLVWEDFCVSLCLLVLFRVCCTRFIKKTFSFLVNITRSNLFRMWCDWASVGWFVGLLHQLLLGTLGTNDVCGISDETTADQCRFATGTAETVVVPVTILKWNKSSAANAYNIINKLAFKKLNNHLC